MNRKHDWSDPAVMAMAGSTPTSGENPESDEQSAISGLKKVTGAFG
ncbi:MAG: hypothetical protein ACYDCK_08750 [Thermoplasmatota archaeon]